MVVTEPKKREPGKRELVLEDVPDFGSEREE